MKTIVYVMAVSIAVLLMPAVFPDVEAYEEKEISYMLHIKPMFEEKCGICHGADAPEYKEFKKNKKMFEEIRKGPKMDSYPHLIYFIGWPDTGAVMRRLDDGKNTKDSKPGNMYQYLGNTEEERQKNLMTFKKWIGYWTLKRWSAVAKEEIDEIKVTY